MPDKRAKVHIAGIAGHHGQRCIRCSAQITGPGESGFPPAAAVANYGHGSWAVLEPAQLDGANMRPCKPLGGARA